MQLRKLATTAVGALLAGATLAAPAAAQTLDDLPAPFVQDGQADFVTVVGADASTADVVGAVDIAARFGGEAVTATTTTTGQSPDSETEEVNLGDPLDTDFTSSMKQNKLDYLFDGTVNLDGTSFSSREQIELGSSARVETSLSSGIDDYKDNVYIEMQKGDLGYYYVFEETINLSKRISNDDLVIDFLGDELTITSVDDSNTFTAEVGEKFSLNAGETHTVAGKSVGLSKTGSSNALVTVDGTSEAISEGSTETVNGIRVKVDTIFDSDGSSDDSAILIAGEDAAKSISDDDEYIGEDESDPAWVWDVGDLDIEGKGTVSPGDGSGPTLGVINAFVLADEDGDQDAGVDSITNGDSVSYPSDFTTLSFDALNPSGDPLSVTVNEKDSMDLSDVDGFGSTEEGYTIEAGQEDSLVATSGAFFETSSDESTDTITLVTNTTSAGSNETVSVIFEDANNDEVFHGDITLTRGGEGPTNYQSIGHIDFGDTTGDSRIELIGALSNNTDGTLSDFNLTFQDNHLNENVTIDFGIDTGTSPNTLSHLGSTEDESQSQDVVFNSSDHGSTRTPIGTKDENHRTSYGIVVKDPDSTTGSDEVDLTIPSAEMEATVTFSREGTTTTQSQTKGAITSSVSKLDTEVSDPAAEPNLVLVGGPCANRLVSRLADQGDYPWTCQEAVDLGGSGYSIDLVQDAFTDGQAALIVAGQTSDDTRAAASRVQAFNQDGLTGKQVRTGVYAQS